MKQQLTTQHAQVTTAAVEIKTLTIAGKQVALTVFRQLKSELLIDPETGDLKGIPWGTVNYHPDKCTDQDDHLHVVWQKDAELRRATELLVGIRAGWFWTDISDDYVQTAYCLNGHVFPEGMRPARDADGLENVRYYFEHFPCETATRPDRAYVRDHRCSTKQTHDELREEMRELITLEVARREKLNQQWHALAELPQLFIAV